MMWRILTQTAEAVKLVAAFNINLHYVMCNYYGEFMNRVLNQLQTSIKFK